MDEDGGKTFGTSATCGYVEFLTLSLGNGWSVRGRYSVDGAEGLVKNVGPGGAALLGVGPPLIGRFLPCQIRGVEMYPREILAGRGRRADLTRGAESGLGMESCGTTPELKFLGWTSGDQTLVLLFNLMEVIFGDLEERSAGGRSLLVVGRTWTGSGTRTNQEQGRSKPRMSKKTVKKNQEKCE